MINRNKKDSYFVVEANVGEIDYWRDVWNFRELFYVLAWRDLAVRYKQTVIGLMWALIQPFLTMIVFTVIFGKIAKLPGFNNVPYAIVVLSGLLPWQFFSSALLAASSGLLSNASLISKVYFPRIIIPVSAVVVSFVDFIVGFMLLVCVYFWYGFSPNIHVLALPIFIVMCALASFGPSLWVAGLNLKYRDFRYIIPFMIQIGIYVSPIAFTSSIVPHDWRMIYSLNPMVGVIDGFRWCLLGDNVDIYIEGQVISWCIILVFLFIGVRQFQKIERSFADLV
jgi:lipopolysaccharide transport system permease protein